jgi:peptide/nickel transport system substrate-binding protein
VVGIALALTAVSCGSDDDSDSGASGSSGSVGSAAESTGGGVAPTTSEGSVPPTTEEGSVPPTTEEGSVPPATEDAPRAGGSLTFSLFTFPTSWDPMLASSQGQSAGNYIYPVFGSLVQLDFETATKATPNFAKSLETDDGGLTWTLVLHEGIMFSDGEPYDAEAVKFNWDRYMAGAPTKSLGAQRIASYEVVDPLTLRITLTEPVPQWPTLLAALVFIGSPKALTEKGDAFATSPVGAGPFVVKEIVSGQSMTLERNPTYWKDDLPYLDELTLISQPDGARRVDALLAGEVDVAFSKPDGIDRLKDAGLVELADPSLPGWGFAGWVPNAARPPFDDRELRCAMVQSIDREAMNRDLSHGYAPQRHEDGTVFDSFIHRGPAYEGAHKLPKYDRDAAQAVFDAYADTTGGPLTFTLQTLELYGPETQYLVTQWATYDNLEVNVDTKTVPELFPQMIAGGHELALIGWGGEYSAGYNLNQYGHSKPDGTANGWTGFTSPEFDAALDEFLTATDEQAQIDAVRRAQDIVVDECLFNPIPRAGLSAPFGKDSIKGWSIDTLTPFGIDWERIWLGE